MRFKKSTDRQRISFGDKGSSFIENSLVLILGSSPLAFEIGRILALSGVSGLRYRAYSDDILQEISYSDIENNCLLLPEDFGKKRLKTSVKRLKEYSPKTNITIYKEDLNENSIETFDVVVSTYNILSQINIDMDSLCHKCEIPFITGNTFGLFGSIFTDANSFISSNEQCLPFFFESNISEIMIHNGKLALKTTESIQKLANKSKILISGIKDKHFRFLNNSIFKIVKSNNIIYCCDDDSNDIYNRVETTLKKHFNGITMLSIKGNVKQIPEEASFKFEMLINQLENPRIYPKSNFEKPSIIHFELMKNISKCMDKEENLSNSEELFLSYCKESNVLKDYKYCDVVAKSFRLQIPPVISFYGAIISQQILNFIMKAGTPIQQWYFVDFFDVIYDSSCITSFENNINDRYSNIRNLMGSDFIEQIHNLKSFIVGVGAIGCEVLKCFSQFGVGKDNGYIMITDMDRIEETNLGRQYLFSCDDIGQYKSVTASKKVKIMNPDLNVQVHTEPICSDTDSIFRWEEYNEIITAIDNIKGRKHAAKKSIAFSKVMHDASIYSLQGNSCVYIPNVTTTYNISDENEDYDENSQKASCTVKFNPSKLVHVTTWSYHQLRKLFSPPKVNQQKDNNKQKEINFSDISTEEEAIAYFVQVYKESNDFFSQVNSLDPTEWGKKLFNDLFYDRIKTLISLKSKLNSSVVKEIKYDDSNVIHKAFVESAANLCIQFKNSNENTFQFDKDDDNQEMFLVTASTLRAENFGIPNKDRNEIKTLATKVEPTVITSTVCSGALLCLEWMKVHSTWKLIENKDIKASYFKETSFLLSNMMFMRSAQYSPSKNELEKLWNCCTYNINDSLNVKQFYEILNEILGDNVMSCFINDGSTSTTIISSPTRLSESSILKEIIPNSLKKCNIPLNIYVGETLELRTIFISLH